MIPDGDIKDDHWRCAKGETGADGIDTRLESTLERPENEGEIEIHTMQIKYDLQGEEKQRQGSITKSSQ